MNNYFTNEIHFRWLPGSKKPYQDTVNHIEMYGNIRDEEQAKKAAIFFSSNKFIYDSIDDADRKSFADPYFTEVKKVDDKYQVKWIEPNCE